MSNNIDFYFDFSSSYSYLAHARINEIEEKTGKTVVFRPIVLGAIFHSNEHTVPDSSSVKMKYFDMDLRRCADSLGIDFQLPPVFPFNAILPMRVFYALNAVDQSLAREFCAQAFNTAYTKNRDISQPQELANLMSDLKLDLASITAGGAFVQAKAELKMRTQEAMTLNVFGAPTFEFSGELFWGADRIDMLINRVINS